jgi:predicted N-formylglutamate amidohydrolase
MSPKAPNGDSAMVSKQVIWTLVGVQPMPLAIRASRSAVAKPLPRTRPEKSLVHAIVSRAVMPFPLSSAGMLWTPVHKMQRRSSPAALLSPADPPPVEVIVGSSGWLLTVEHAGRAVPERLGNLGLPCGEIDRHIGWDPGALLLARRLRERLGATLVAQPYSRLIIDCNRPREAPDLVPEASDGTPVPANVGLAEKARRERWEAIHAPFHAAVARACEAAPQGLLAVHSYDPRRRSDAAVRPWPLGLLWRRDNPLAHRLAERLSRHEAARPLGINEPYAIEDASDFTIPVHAEPRGLPHVLIEVRTTTCGTPPAWRAWPTFF